MLPSAYGSHMSLENQCATRPMTTEEVAHRLGYTPRHVARLAAEGTIVATRLPSPKGFGRFLFDPAVVDEYKRERGGAKRVRGGS